MRDLAICASWMGATRSYSARVMASPRYLVESSTRSVDRVLRESTRALTFTFPNSVIVALGISSVSSRNRAAVGFHSTREPFTWYATVFPPPGHTPHAAVTPARARWPAHGETHGHAGTRIQGRHDFVDSTRNRKNYCSRLPGGYLCIRDLV